MKNYPRFDELITLLCFALIIANIFPVDLNLPWREIYGFFSYLNDDEKIDDRWFTLATGAMAIFAAWLTIHHQNKNSKKQFFWQRTQKNYDCTVEEIKILAALQDQCTFYSSHLERQETSDNSLYKCLILVLIKEYSKSVMLQLECYSSLGVFLTQEEKRDLDMMMTNLKWFNDNSDKNMFNDKCAFVRTLNEIKIFSNVRLKKCDEYLSYILREIA